MNAVIELTQAQRIVLVDPNELPSHWDKLEPLVAKACEYSRGEATPESIVGGVLSGALRMLAYMDETDILSIAVLSVSQFPTGIRVLEVLHASGEGLRDWRQFQSQVADYGKAHGCSKFRMIGREGLQRMLPDWKRVGIVLEREFD